MWVLWRLWQYYIERIVKFSEIPDFYFFTLVRRANPTSIAPVFRPFRIKSLFWPCLCVDVVPFYFLFWSQEGIATMSSKPPPPPPFPSKEKLLAPPVTKVSIEPAAEAIAQMAGVMRNMQEGGCQEQQSCGRSKNNCGRSPNNCSEHIMVMSNSRNAVLPLVGGEEMSDFVMSFLRQTTKRQDAATVLLTK